MSLQTLWFLPRDSMHVLHQQYDIWQSYYYVLTFDRKINVMDKIWDRKSFEVGGRWPLWRGWKTRMTTQNRQKSNAKNKTCLSCKCWSKDGLIETIIVMLQDIYTNFNAFAIQHVLFKEPWEINVITLQNKIVIIFLNTTNMLFLNLL